MRGLVLMLAALTLVAGCGLPSANADAVPPPPRSCPPGQVGVTSHAGPRCVPKAPTNCPAGWYGVVGGECLVHTCETDDVCGKGKHCREVDVCLHEWFQEWGEATRPDPFTLAAPPRRFDPPVRRVDVVNICTSDGRCGGKDTCAKGKVCLPNGVTKAGHWDGRAK